MAQSRIEQLKSFLNADPEDTFTRFALALEYVKAGDDKSASELFTSIIKKNPACTGVYYHMGKLLERNGKPDEALKVYTSGIEVCSAANDLHSLQELQQAMAEAVEGD
jgi:tetratricopeptide (TPR) repeat protein